MEIQQNNKKQTPDTDLPTTGQVAIGHPVDVASGTLFHDFTDYTLPGRFPLAFKRHYSTALLNITTPGILGRGWSTSFEVRLSKDDNGYRYLDESGEKEIVFPLSESGEHVDQRILNAGAYADLTLVNNEYCITRWDSDTGDITRDYFPSNDQQHLIPIARRENGESAGIEFRYSKSSGLLKYVLQTREQRGFQFKYDEANRLVQVLRKSRQSGELDKISENEPWLQFHYNNIGMLQSFTDPLGHQSHYSYDSDGQMDKEITTAGKEWRFVFDEQGRCIVTTAKNRFDYHKLDYGMDKERVTKVEDSYGNITQYFYNQFGQVVNTVSPLGNEKKTVFDIAGREVLKVNDQGSVVQFGYDDFGNRNSFSTADGATVRYTYNDQHLPVTFTDAMGSTWKRQYDQNGRIVQTSNPLEATENFRYNASGDLAEHTNANQDNRTFSWDNFGNITGSSDWLGNHTSYSWDAYGEIAEVVDPAGHVVSVQRDRLGRLSNVSYPDGTQSKYQWNVFDSLSEFVDERGNATTYQYCDCGNIEVEQRPDGSTIHYGWDAIPGQLIALTNQNSEVFHFEYDDDGRMIRETDFAGTITQFEYNEVGKISRVVKPSGRQVEYDYDAVGRLINVKYDDDTESRYAFDLNGRLVSANNGQCAVTFEYDQIGRLIHESQGQHELWHEYDELNRRISRRTASDESTHYAWNANSQIDKILPDGFEDIAFTYDARGIEQNRQFGNNLNFTSSVDARGRLVSQELENGSSTESVKRDYVYDVSGNLLQKKDSNWGVTHYAYDELERITKTLHPDGEAELFRYDSADNVVAYARGKFDSGTGKESSVLNSGTWSYTKGSRVVKQEGVDYHYDDDGQLIKRTDSTSETSYLWNAAGQLTGIDKGNGEIWRYTYDALSRRVLKEGPEESREYVWDGDVVLKECKVKGAEKVKTDWWEYNPNDFSPLYKVQDTEQYFSLNDQIGTPLELVNGRGDIVWSIRSYTYGEGKQFNDNHVDCNIRFQGQWFDEESGLSYNRYRYFSPATTSFLSNDPTGLSGGINTYSYNRNPVSWIDPYGLTESCTIASRPYDRTEVETKSGKAVKLKNATDEWDNFLGEHQTNIDPRDGLPDPDRIWSADGKRSIRFGSHEMDSTPRRFHYHQETWHDDKVENVLQRVPQ